MGAKRYESEEPEERAHRRSTARCLRSNNRKRGTKVERTKSGCYTCRIRRKKCDENISDNSCRTCTRLHLECLGFGSKRPEWMRDRAAVKEVLEKIKNFLSAQGLIKGHTRTSAPQPSESFLKLSPATSGNNQVDDDASTSHSSQRHSSPSSCQLFYESSNASPDVHDHWDYFPGSQATSEDDFMPKTEDDGIKLRPYSHSPPYESSHRLTPDEGNEEHQHYYPGEMVQPSYGMNSEYLPLGNGSYDENPYYYERLAPSSGFRSSLSGTSSLSSIAIPQLLHNPHDNSANHRSSMYGNGAET